MKSSPEDVDWSDIDLVAKLKSTKPANLMAWYREFVYLSGRKKYQAKKSKKSILETAYGKEHSKIAAALDNIGSVYVKWKKPSTAVNYFKKAYEMYKALHGMDNPLTQKVAKQINECLIEQQQAKKS